MKEYHIVNIKDTRFEFETKSKRRVLDVINGKARMPYKVEEQDFVVINDKLSLPIELSKWKDIDDDSDFINVLKTLIKITDIKKGSALLVIAVKLVGYDIERKRHFVFVNRFVDGKHTVVGQYENATSVLVYKDRLYIEE